MTKFLMLASASILSLSVALPAVAQSTRDTDLTGISGLNDRIDDIEEDVADDMAAAADASRFGNPEFNPGFSGSASLGYSGQSGNTDSQDLTVAMRLRYAQGQLVQTLGAAIDFSELDGTKTTQDVFAIYDAAYYFNDTFYGFAMARIESDGLGDTLTAQDIADGVTLAGKVKTDAFLGFGPGYRVVNTPDMSWRVQAGIGVRYQEMGNNTSTTETGYIASSRFFYKLTETSFITNDTDVLKSDASLAANNDFGINFKITDSMSTRISYLTEYNDSRAIRTDNKLGVSVVFGF
mgnify:CR=1 FL=1|jgi:putative salt-induced outer membrane protein